MVTRVRAAYVNPDGFRFRLRLRTLASDVRRLFGGQDVEVGDESFDREFVLQTNRPEFLKRLLSEADVRAGLLGSNVRRVEVLDDEGWFGPEFPSGVDELRLERPGRVTAAEELAALYSVFAEILNSLCHLSAAYDQDPRLAL